MDEADWAINEFGSALLGDQRRTDRLIALASVLAQRPEVSLPAACDDPAMRKGAYRFFENDVIEPAAILASHGEATGERVAAVPLVLAVHDTTERDFSSHPATTGLGPLRVPRKQGLVVHSTLAVTPDGLPLGLLAQEVWARPELPPEEGKRKKAKRPVADRESQKWCTSLAAVGAGREAAPQTTLVSVGDREADIYALFLAPRPPGVELLVRAQHDRWVRVPRDESQYIHYLRAELARAPLAGTRAVLVSRQVGHRARTAQVTLRYLPLTLRQPEPFRDAWPTVHVWAVAVREETPPPGVAEPLDWLLLTTVAVLTPADALERVDWSICRSRRGGMAQGAQIRLLHRAAAVGQCRQPATGAGGLQRDRLAIALRHSAGPGRAGRALHGSAGGGGMAGPLLRHPPDDPAT
jgi:Transposase DNA-binding